MIKKTFSNFMVPTTFSNLPTGFSDSVSDTFSDTEVDLNDLSHESIKNIYTYNSFDYRDLDKTTEEQIELEKRRRHQIYMLLDHVLSVVTYFDFFSYDTFTMIERSKYWAEAAKRPLLTGEFLLMPFLDPEFEFSDMLKEYNFNEEGIWKLIKLSNKVPKLSFWQHKSFYLYNLFEKRFSFFTNCLVSKNIKYSYDTRVLFEKAAENALTRFKTPVITPEILFITMMEQKTAKVGRIIKRYFPEETSWYLFRYRLIKRIHFQEVAIRTLVTKNEQYFAYLLKINLPEYEFNKMIEMDLLNLGVTTFRNKLVIQLLTMDIFDLLERDIAQSIRLMRKKRKYLTRRSPRKYST